MTAEQPRVKSVTPGHNQPLHHSKKYKSHIFTIMSIGTRADLWYYVFSLQVTQSWTRW